MVLWVLAGMLVTLKLLKNRDGSPDISAQLLPDGLRRALGQHDDVVWSCSVAE